MLAGKENPIGAPLLVREGAVAVVPPARPSFFSRAKSFITAPAKFVGKMLVAIPGALLFSVNAFLSPSHTNPSEVNKAWYNNLSSKVKVLSFVFGVSSLVINTILNYRTIPKAFKMLVIRLYDFSSNKKKNIKFIILTTGSALSAAAIGYQNFLFGGTALAISSATFSFFVFWGTRFFGLVKLDERYYRSFDVQHKSVNQLKRMKKRHIDRLNEELSGRTLNQESVVHILKVTQEIVANDPDFLDRGGYEYIASCLDYVFAIMAGLSVVPVSSQKLVDGAQLIAPLPIMRSMSVGAVLLKNLISLPSGMASPLLYFGQTLDLRQTIERLIEHLKNNEVPAKTRAIHFLSFVALFAMNIFACASNYNLTEGLAKDEYNIFKWLLANDSTVEIFSCLSAGAAFTVNAKIAVDQMSEEFPPPSMNVDSPSVPDVIKWLRVNVLPIDAKEDIEQHHLRLRR